MFDNRTMTSLVTGPRARQLNDREPASGPVILWISRDQRCADNWALTEALRLACDLGSYVIAAFCLRPRCGMASRRHYEFMLEGLVELEGTLGDAGIPFLMRHGWASQIVPELAARFGAGATVCDFAPFTRARRERELLAAALNSPLIEVDTRNIVPAWTVADKQLYAAHHLRTRYRTLLPPFQDEPAPQPRCEGADPALFERFDYEAALATVKADEHGPPITLDSGEVAATVALKQFVDERLPGYAVRRGDPSVDGQSGLSPYLHFGQLSSQRAVSTVLSAAADPNHAATSEDAAEFVEEATIWRELADNYCLFNAAYASFDGFPTWARETLSLHAGDAREIVYSVEQFEAADTHDDLWNAAQTELVHTGKMHNYMRMYWAKKILEWSETPAEAVRIAVLLNDRYALDGRESSGYAGIAWSIGGVHDRPWPERSVYGKIRYMNRNGASRKFDVNAYIARATGVSGRIF